jgi:hypothetical protein
MKSAAGGVPPSRLNNFAACALDPQQLEACEIVTAAIAGKDSGAVRTAPEF